MSVIKQVTATEPKSLDVRGHEASALAIATALGHKLDDTIQFLTKAKADYEGGPFKVMFTVLDTLTPEQIASIPDMDTETGNNPRFYKVPVIKTDGKEKITDRDFYKVIADGLPDVQAKHKRVDMIGRSMNPKMNHEDVPQEIKDMPLHRRHAEISKLSRTITTAHNNVIKALELYSQFNRFETLPGVTAAMIWKAREDGLHELNGEEGRASEVDETRSPIVLTTKLESRKAIDTNRYSVNSFLKFNVPKALEQGGSWAALMATVKKGKKEKDAAGNANARNVNTIDTMEQVMADAAEALARWQDDRTKTDWEALKKALTTGAGSDDAFYNASVVFNALELLVGDPKSKVRFQKLFSEREQAAA